MNDIVDSSSIKPLILLLKEEINYYDAAAVLERIWP